MDYSVIYSARRSIGIKIENGKIIVKAPYGTGAQIIEKALFKHREWIEKALVRERKRRESESVIDGVTALRLREEAKKYFGEKCPYYARLMGTDYTKLNITSARKRFGSCSAKGSISFSYLLMLYPEAAREYVIVHELAHRTEMNHSCRFYAIVEKYMPDYKERRALLKKQ